MPVKLSQLFVALTMLLSLSLAAAENTYSLTKEIQKGPPHEIQSQRIEASESTCNLIDFEGIGNNTQIGLISGSPNVTFGSSWLGIIDADAGGGGNFANEPSPSTTAYFLDIENHNIDFDSGVQFVEVYYSASVSSVPVTLTAFDGPNGTGEVVDTAVGSAIGASYDGAICSGDPEGQFCAWYSIDLTAATNNISSITLQGAVANLIGFDNMRFCTTPVNYVALGDSYSSGEGAENYYIDLDRDGETDPGEDTDYSYEDHWNKCHRSANAYAWKSRFLHDVKASGFFACSGAETINVKPEGNDQEYKFPDNVTQLRREPIDQDTQLVTITVGGNDARFAKILRWCYDKPNCEDYDPWGSAGVLRDYVPKLITDTVKPSVKATLQDIKAQAENAQIYLLGYPKLFVSGGSDCELLTERFGNNSWEKDEQDWLNGLSVKLNTALRQAASEEGVGFIPVANLFETHALCSSDNWFREPEKWNLLSKEIFHPTDIGQLKGYRVALEDRLKSDGKAAVLQSQSRLSQTKRQVDEAQPQGDPLPTIGTLRITAVDPVCESGIFPPGQAIEVSGEEYAAGTEVTLSLSSTDGVQEIGNATVDPSGAFIIHTFLPDNLSESYLALVEARGTGANGAPRVSVGSFAIGPEVSSDSDLDGIPDICDICRINYDPAQQDSDSDGLGDACDVCPLDASNDSDSDGLCADVDPCPMDSINDGDLDGRCAIIDNCPTVFNPDQRDSDDDLFGDACDVCFGTSDLECFFSSGFE